MTSFIDPYFTPHQLHRYQGYHLQVFQSGRAKLSLQGHGRDKRDYYCERVKRDREGYRRQKLRSYADLPEHFDRVDVVLSRCPGVVVFRVHRQGDNNATADNVHLLASQEGTALWLVFGAVIHEWEVPTPVLLALLLGRGPRRGVASVFHEYMASYEHDWEDAQFFLGDYRFGYRPQGSEGAEYSQSVERKPARFSYDGPVQPSPLSTPPAHPDGSEIVPYDDEPDPEDLVAWREAEASEEFEAVGLSGLGQARVRPSPRQEIRAQTKDELWDAIWSQN